jgi:hypothetical protein
MLKFFCNGFISVGWNTVFLLIHHPTSFVIIWILFSLFSALVFGIYAAQYRVKLDAYRSAQRQAGEEDTTAAYVKVNHIKEPRFSYMFMFWLLAPIGPALNYYWFFGDPVFASFAGLSAFALTGGTMVLVFFSLRPFFQFLNQAWNAPLVH